MGKKKPSFEEQVLAETRKFFEFANLAHENRFRNLSPRETQRYKELEYSFNYGWFLTRAVYQIISEEKPDLANTYWKYVVCHERVFFW